MDNVDNNHIYNDYKLMDNIDDNHIHNGHNKQGGDSARRSLQPGQDRDTSFSWESIDSQVDTDDNIYR